MTKQYEITRFEHRGASVAIETGHPVTWGDRTACDLVARISYPPGQSIRFDLITVGMEKKLPPLLHAFFFGVAPVMAVALVPLFAAILMFEPTPEASNTLYWVLCVAFIMSVPGGTLMMTRQHVLNDLKQFYRPAESASQHLERTVRAVKEAINRQMDFDLGSANPQVVATLNYRSTALDLGLKVPDAAAVPPRSETAA